MGGSSVLPALVIGGAIYAFAGFPSNVPTPAYNPVGDIAIGLRLPSVDATKPLVLSPAPPQTKAATLPAFTHKVYEIGGWDIVQMKWQTLKYGVASMLYDTYGGAGNRRPDSQLEYMRSRYPMLMIRQITRACFTDKPSAHAFETGMVGLYQMRNKGESPPEQILPY